MWRGAPARDLTHFRPLYHAYFPDVVDARVGRTLLSAFDFDFNSFRSTWPDSTATP